MNFYYGDISELSHDSFSGSKFGVIDQVTVLGHTQDGYVKTYVVSCAVCQKDPELFQNGLFTSSRGHLNMSKIPCGCSSIPKWNQAQQLLRAKRSANKMGYGFRYDPSTHPYTGQTARCFLTCEIHGEWETHINGVILERVCIKCSAASGRSRKPDNVMIQGFLDSGAFHPETIFYRSDRKTVQGAKNYWWVECPVCNSKGEVNSSDLRKGNQPCECVKNQRQSYVNLVSDRETPVAIKFGIAKAYKTRVQKQNRRSIYDVTNLKAWEFPTKESCILAELECKQSLDCGVVPKEEMPDGFSETTHVYNLDKISEIFEKHGGVTIH